MGLLILLLFLITALISLLPAHSRMILATSFESHRKILNLLYILFATAFVCFGMVRMLFNLNLLLP